MEVTIKETVLCDVSVMGNTVEKEYARENKKEGIYANECDEQS